MSSITWDMLDAVVARLGVKLPGFAAEYFPERPSEYRLNHPVGALLVGYGGSRYGSPEEPRAVVQQRDAIVTVTLVFRQLHGRDGAVMALDDVREALLGYRLPNTTAGLRALRDTFLGQVSGLWQYALDLAAPALAIEDTEDDDGPLLRHITRLGPFERTETIKRPDGSITEEDFQL